MKILMTGMTAQQCGRVPQAGYATVASMLVRLLEDLGHQVDVVKVMVGENYDGYDMMIVGVISPFSIAAKNIYGALWLLDQYWITHRVPVLSLVDDWTLHSVDQNSRSARRGLFRIVNTALFTARPNFEWANSATGYNSFRRVFERAVETGWPPAAWPAYGWGDHSVFRRHLTAEDYFPLDLTCYTPAYPFAPVPSSERSREWVLAAVQDHTEWLEKLNLGWELNKIGGGLTKRDSVMQESDVIQEYARCRGVMSPPYIKLHGSGWWRNRFVYAARTKSVLLCDPGEAPQLGETYMMNPGEIEKLSDHGLDQLAEAQAGSLRKGCWTGEELHARAEEMLERVMAGAVHK